MAEYVFSGTFNCFPRLAVVYSEASIGRMPYMLWTGATSSTCNAVGVDSQLQQRPSEYFDIKMLGCFTKDELGASFIERLAVDAIMAEVD